MAGGYSVRNLRTFDRNIFRSGRAVPRILEQVPHCWMCSDADSPQSKEHVFAESLMKHLPKELVYAEPVRFAHGGVVLASKRGRTSGTNLVAGGVCERCNNVWMNDLEVAAQPFLLGRRTIVTGDDIGILARWMVKTAIVINTSMPYRLLWTAERRHCVKHGMPGNVHVWLYRVPDIDMNWMQGAAVHALTLPTEDVERLAPLVSLVAMCQIQFRDLVGVVLARPGEFTNATATMDEAALLWRDGEAFELHLDELPRHEEPFMKHPRLDVHKSVFWR